MTRFWKILFFATALFLLILFPFLSRDYGITWDEWMQANNGMTALRNLWTFGKDLSFLEHPLWALYSQLFQSLTGFAYALLSGRFQSFPFEGLQDAHAILTYFHISHAVNSLFGWAAIFLTGLFAQRLSGWRAGWLALIFAALSPRFLGNSMNDPKDIPFAAGYMFAVYGIGMFLRELPRPGLKSAVTAAFGIATAIGTRIGGFLLVAYLFLFTTLVSGKMYWKAKLSSRGILKNLLAACAIGAAAVALGLIFWPFGRTYPWKIPAAIQEISNFSHWKGTVLFEGRLISADDLPWYYSIKWIWISSPVFFCSGILLWLCLWPQHLRTLNRRLYGLTVFAAVFPIVYVIYKKSMLADSWRHLLFVYPPWIVLAAVSWDQFFRLLPTVFSRRLAGIGLALLLFFPAVWIVRNYPNTYVYFSPLAGGLKRAFYRYDTDYWGNSIREASQWLGKFHKEKFPNTYAIVRADGSLMQSYPYLAESLGPYYIPLGYQKDFLKTNPTVHLGYGPLRRDQPWNYAIVISRERTSSELQQQWPPPGTLYAVKADGMVLCAVVANPESQLFQPKNKSL